MSAANMLKTTAAAADSGTAGSRKDLERQQPRQMRSSNNSMTTAQSRGSSVQPVVNRSQATNKESQTNETFRGNNNSNIRTPPGAKLTSNTIDLASSKQKFSSFNSLSSFDTPTTTKLAAATTTNSQYLSNIKKKLEYESSGAAEKKATMNELLLAADNNKTGGGHLSTTNSIDNLKSKLNLKDFKQPQQQSTTTTTTTRSTLPPAKSQSSLSINPFGGSNSNMIKSSSASPSSLSNKKPPPPSHSIGDYLILKLPVEKEIKSLPNSCCSKQWRRIFENFTKKSQIWMFSPKFLNS
jgi:hypothetical protein